MRKINLTLNNGIEDILTRLDRLEVELAEQDSLQGDHDERLAALEQQVTQIVNGVNGIAHLRNQIAALEQQVEFLSASKENRPGTYGYVINFGNPEVVQATYTPEQPTPAAQPPQPGQSTFQQVGNTMVISKPIRRKSITPEQLVQFDLLSQVATKGKNNPMATTTDYEKFATHLNQFFTEGE